MNVMSRNSSTAVALAVAALFAAPLAAGHTDEYLATLKAPHDGQLRVAGPYHLELVVARDNIQAAEKPVVVYVTDHGGAAITTVGASGTITLLGGGKKVTAKLQPAGENSLKATVLYASTTDLKAVVSVQMADKSEASARFTPVANEKPMPSQDAVPDPHAGHH